MGANARQHAWLNHLGYELQIGLLVITACAPLLNECLKHLRKGYHKNRANVKDLLRMRRNDHAES